MKTAKLITKVSIITFALLRLLQAFCHLTFYYLKNHKMFSSKTVLSLTVSICSLVLLIGAIGESPVFLEIWMVWTVLKFGAVIFSVFDLSFENNSFFRNSTLINVTISSSKKKKAESFVKNLIFFLSLSVLQILTLIMVLKLHKLLTREDDEFLSDNNDEMKSFQHILTLEGQEAVAFEPFLFSNLMLEH